MPSLSHNFAKELLLLLRHNAVLHRLTPTPNGFVAIADILALRCFSYARELSIRELVSSRPDCFELDERPDPGSDGEVKLWIRATFGHTISSIDVNLVEISEAAHVRAPLYHVSSDEWLTIQRRGGIFPTRRRDLIQFECTSGDNDDKSTRTSVTLQLHLGAALRGGLRFYYSGHGLLFTRGTSKGLVPIHFLSPLVHATNARRQHMAPAQPRSDPPPASTARRNASQQTRAWLDAYLTNLSLQQLLASPAPQALLLQQQSNALHERAHQFALIQEFLDTMPDGEAAGAASTPKPCEVSSSSHCLDPPTTERVPCIDVHNSSLSPWAAVFHPRTAYSESPVPDYEPRWKYDPSSLPQNDKSTSEITNPKAETKWIIVPIAPPGCGKTNLCKALSQLFGFAHVRSSQAQARTASAFIDSVVQHLSKTDVVIADRSNHLRTHRAALRSASGRLDVPVKLLALQWDLRERECSYVQKVCAERIKFSKRDHHWFSGGQGQSLDSILWKFLRQAQPLVNGEVDACINLSVDDDLEAALHWVIREGLEKYLAQPSPRDHDVLAAIANCA